MMLRPMHSARFWLFLLWVAAGASPCAFAQARYQPRYIEPQWFTFRLSEVSAGVYAEGNYQQTRVENSGATVSYQRLFAGPSLSLNANGSVYHPNLLQYFLRTDGAFGYSEYKVRSGASTTTREWQYLGSFSTELLFLADKPFNASAFASYDHSYRDNDFFTRTLVESWRYGGRLVWDHEPWLFTAGYQHRGENGSSRYPINQVVLVPVWIGGTPVFVPQTNTVDVTQETVIDEDNANLELRHRRDRGDSLLSYSLNHYSRADGPSLSDGTDHAVSIGDNERFGAADQYRLHASASMVKRDTTFETSDEYIGNLGFSAEHRPNLRSQYDLTYDHFETGPFTSDNFNGQGTLSHQLYESLGSSLIVRGSDAQSSDAASSSSITRVGGGISEVYTKRLTDEHHLRLGASVFLDHNEQENTGDFRTIQNERHTVTAAGEPGAGPWSFLLEFPNVLTATIVVRDPDDPLRTFFNGFHYLVEPRGSRTAIVWLRPIGEPIPPAVVVDYQSDITPPGSYETLTTLFHIRFDLWKNLLGLYGRVSVNENNAPADLRIQEYSTYTVGTDFNWRWFRAGAEYQIYDSTDSDYNVTRLFQSFMFRPDDVSSLNLDFTETLTDFTSLNRTEEDYRFTTRYRRALTRRLGLDADAGVAYRRGLGPKQILATLRPSLRYVIGRTTLNVGYDYDYELYLDQQERQKHLLFVRLKRIF